jgi:hypothetical protein
MASPSIIRGSLLVGGVLLSAFADRLPEGLQTLGLVAGIVLIVFAGLAMALQYVRRRRGGKIVSPSDLITIGLGGIALCALIALAGVLLLRFQQASGHNADTSNAISSAPDISWSFDSPEPRMYFLGLLSAASGAGSEPPKMGFNDVRVGGFQAQGKNNLGQPINRVSGYIRSDITNQSFPIYLVVDKEPVPPEETYGIPALATFTVVTWGTILNMQKDGMPVADFLRDFASFTFVFEYDEKNSAKQRCGGKLICMLNKFLTMPPAMTHM